MPRINVEDKWYDDPRRITLIEKIGQLATDGTALQIWRVAQNYYRLETLIPREVFFSIKHGPDFITAGLAVESDGGVYIRGSTECFKWIGSRKGSGRRGAEATNSKSQQTPANSGKSQQTPASSSYSSSSEKKNTNAQMLAAACAADSNFQEIYSQYPKKKGKSVGYKVFCREIKTPEDLQSLQTSLERFREYHARNKTDPRYLPYFSTYMGTWRECLDPDWGESDAVRKVIRI